MNNVLFATVAGLVTAFCWGTGDWLTAKSSKQQSAIDINFVVQSLGVLVILPFLYGVHFPTGLQLLNMVFVAACIGAAYLLFVKALAVSQVGIMSPLANTYPLATLALSVIFVGSVFSGKQVLAMIIIISGAVLLAYQKNHRKLPLQVLYKEVGLVVGAACLWGLAFFVVNFIVKDVSWQVLTGGISILMALIAGLLFVITHRSETRPALKRAFHNKFAVLSGIIFEIGSIAFYVGGTHTGNIILTAVIGSGGPLVASFWGYVIDREKIGILKRVGAIAVVAGIIILNTG